MKREEVFNFAAGPAVLPEPVLEKAASELPNYNGTGMSVMEMSHRGSEFLEIFNSAKDKLKEAMGIPDTHEILLLQGGASTQFSMVPLNLMGENAEADYAVTGNFANIAMKEAKKFGRVNIAYSTEAAGHTYIPAGEDLQLSGSASYFYYCSNNTIYGTEWKYIPDVGNTTLVCDMSSNILSKPVDVSKYGLIFAGAQKNLAPAGLTIVIIDKSLAGREQAITPLMMSYKTMIEKDSMYNTPPCYNIYMLSLVLDWIKEQGGAIEMERRSTERASILYEQLDNSKLFAASAKEGSRSNMNITFRSKSPEMDDAFVKAAKSAGLLGVKGHRLSGGMRASCYNAMPLAGVKKLVELMKKFEVENNV